MSINRSNIHKPLLVASLSLLLLSFTGLLGPKAVGLSRGFGAILFILFFICNLLKNEKADDEIQATAVTKKQPARPRGVTSLETVNA